MAAIKRILFPVDFSERCSGAARYVEVFAGRGEAEVTLLHIDVPPDPVWGLPDYFDADVWAQFLVERRAKLEERLQSFLAEELKHFRVVRKLCEGDPARRILEYAAANKPDLIMMPTHGLGIFRRYILGSVTAKVLHDAQCPVWTAAHTELAPPLEQIHVGRMLCAIEPGPEATKVLQWAAGLAREFDSELMVAHAVPIEQSRPAKYLNSEFFAGLVKDAETAIRELQNQIGTQAPVLIEGGRPAEVIHDLAAKAKADLVLIGRTGATKGIGRLRTNGYAIIRSSPCPVVSV